LGLSVAAPAPVASGKADALPTEPQSILSPYELSLGAICGICAGVFIKKGAKLIAFFLGGVYVLMQVCSFALYFVLG
jgi:FUN14 domain-containing protein 1